MLIRSINGETPEGSASRRPRLRRHPRKGPIIKILFIEFYSNVPDGHGEAIQYKYCINIEQQ